MKFWGVVLLVLMLCPTVVARAEQGRSAETTVLPGDQNTNLHRLSAFGEYAVKKLKKIDQALDEQKETDKDVSWADLSNLLSDDQKENEQILQKIAADVDSKVKKPQDLTVKKDDLFKKMRNLKKSSVSDEAVVAALQSQLRGVRR